jgi:hypothetical protein
MGYMGLDSANASDHAADIVYGISKDIVERLTKELEEQDYCYDTNGVVAVALILEGLAPSANHLHNPWGLDSDLAELIGKTVDRLASKIASDEVADWGTDGEDNKAMHLKAYSRMHGALRDFKEKLEV